MNIFTSRIANDEERRRIASRSPVNVFVPTGENTQYVSDFTGNYWPYRSLTLDEIVEDRKMAERTVDRVLDFAIVDTRPPGSNFPHDLYNLGDSLKADYVFPVTYTGTARDAIAYPVDKYRNYDFSHQPTLGTPVPHPYSLTVNCLNEGLYKQQSRSKGISGTSHPTDFVLRELGTHAFEWDSMREAIEYLQESTSGDINVHLHEPPVTADMIRYIRANPGVIDSVILPTDTDTLARGGAAEGTTDALEELFSTKANDYLRGELCPYVRFAAEFSLLCSSFLDITTEKEFATVIDESVIPEGSESMQPVTNAEESQETLTELIT